MSDSTPSSAAVSTPQATQGPFDLLVIGAGPGGYVAAIRAAQLGMNVACVEREPSLGGTCLNWGCIPSKTLLDSSEHYHYAKTRFAHHGIKVGGLELDLPAMMKRKDEVVSSLTKGVAYLFKKNKVTHFHGTARLTTPTSVEIDSTSGKQAVTARHILIATGSAPIELPGLPFDGQRIIHSNHAIGLPKVPGHLLIIGAGVIGLELGSVWRRLGAEVTVIEFLDRIAPNMDREMTSLLQRSLEKLGLKFQFGTAAQSASVQGDHVTVTWKRGTEAGTTTADVVLVAVGRRPYTDGLGARELGVAMDAKGFIRVDKHYRTNIPTISAIGDVIGGLMLAHKAEEEGVAFAELLAGKAGHVNYNAVANVIYTDPELASVGRTEDELKAQGVPYKVGKFPFSANGRAKAMDATEGTVKVLAHAETDRLLGVHILGPRASDMIAEAATAIEFAASCEDIARSVHAHPTLSEALKEAALACDKRALHA
ncbi:MAG: dihydrolipoyl dehydrogenase [Tepidisphaerales bacterium]